MKAEIKKYVDEKYNGKNKSMLISYVATTWMIARADAQILVEDAIVGQARDCKNDPEYIVMQHIVKLCNEIK